MKPLGVLCAALLAALSGPAGAAGGLAEVTVFDRTEGRVLPVYWHEGRAHVAGKPGNEYSVRIRSRAREELLAVVSVDGVNVITGETATPAQSGYVLSPYRLLELGGWRKSLERTAAFYFTSLSDSYAARTGRPDHAGVIGVALFRKKQEPQPIARMTQPAPESRARSKARDAAGAAAESAAAAGQGPGRDAEPAAKLGTGHGRSEVSHARYVSFERATSEPAEVLAIYYDSYRNLVARGVIREPVSPCAFPCPLRAPHPFPGFVPDPPA
jgi:hypothetical protein